MKVQVNADAMTLVRYHLMEMHWVTSLGIAGADGKHSLGFDEYPKNLMRMSRRTEEGQIAVECFD